MACQGRNMGFDFGLESAETCFKRKHRWLFIVPDVSAEGIDTLPPSRGARPSFSFKEMEAQHLNETVYYPAKPEWKPITLSLYDIKKPGSSQHPVFEWIKEVYDPQNDAAWVPSCDGFKKRDATLDLYDGCGTLIEQWKFEGIWPQGVEFGDLDMSSSELVTLELTLRYDRAYIVTA